MEKELISIFKEFTNIDFEKNKKLRNEKLLGLTIKLPPRDLVWILLQIEMSLNIKVDKEEVINGNFDTFNNILGILSKKY